MISKTSFLLLTLLIFTVLSFQDVPNRPIKSLPDKLIAGYAKDEECDEKLVTTVKQGVNVLIWFSINLSINNITNQPEITHGPNMDCVGRTVKEISDLNLPVVHMISIGGWDAPHPDTTNPADVMYKALDYWNRNIAARPDLGFYGFDGFDWDIEGNDDTNSPYNTFTVACLDLMGNVSQLAKSQGKYIVSMVPAESYLDPTTSEFDRSLLHTYPEWKNLNPPFAYHGRNCYAYILSKYGQYRDPSKNIMMNTFDFITIQIYESYSHADYQISVKGVSVKDYFSSWVKSLVTGWMVDFSSDSNVHWSTQNVSIPSTQLVIGLANGWAGSEKVVLIYPEDIQPAYEYLENLGISPRGFAYWSIAYEGEISPQRPNEPVYLAAGLNKFLHIRK